MHRRTAQTECKNCTAFKTKSSPSKAFTALGLTDVWWCLTTCVYSNTCNRNSQIVYIKILIMWEKSKWYSCEGSGHHIISHNTFYQQQLLHNWEKQKHVYSFIWLFVYLLIEWLIKKKLWILSLALDMTLIISIKYFAFFLINWILMLRVKCFHSNHLIKYSI